MFVCLCAHLIKFSMPEPIFTKLRVYITVTEPILTAYFINPSHKSVCLCVSHYRCQATARQKVAVATNTQATKDQMLEASFRIRSLSYKKKIDH
jgi:hypothetical protein